MSAKTEKNKQAPPAKGKKTPATAPAAEAPDLEAAEATITPDQAEQAPGQAEQPGEAMVPQSQLEAEQAARATAEAAAAELKNQQLRLQADFDNYRRRSKKDSEDAIHLAAAKLIESFLPVLDNFERAANAMADGPDKEGVLLIGKQLYSTLGNAGLREIEAAGVTFDPNLHHAVSQAEAAEADKGKVLQVLQKGYTLNDRLLRAAMVQVGV